jgi:ribosomal protein L11 methyltransferase
MPRQNAVMSGPARATSIPLTREQAHALVDAVMDREGMALSASAYEDESGEWVFEANCASAPDLDAFAAVAREALGGDVGFTADRIDPSIDWVAKSLEGLQPVTAGGFYVFGSHHTSGPPAGTIPIHIEAAQAFGTGHHETTSGCLEAIDDLLKLRRFRHPIDVGTGTGVLAIALAKRQRGTHVLATDIDPVAVKTAADNARLNNVDRQIEIIEADGLSHPRIARGAPYDLVVANILAGPLVALAPAMGRIAAPGAAIVLSGLLEAQAPRVQAAYARQAMIVSRKLIRGDWATLVLERR